MHASGFMDTESADPTTGLEKSCSCCRSCPSLSSKWHRSVKRRLEQIEDERIVSTDSDRFSVAHVEIENECAILRELLITQQKQIQELYADIEEERNASSSAASEAMSMILRLQREKAEIQMEARQFRRFSEERMAHDQQELLLLEDMLYKREQVIRSLTFETQAFRHRLMSFGFDESEAEILTGRDLTQGESSDTQFEYPSSDYPFLRCSFKESSDHAGMEIPMDIEKYVFGETPRSQSLDLECRIPCNSEIDSSNTLEKVIVGQSPTTKHVRKSSNDSSNSMFIAVKEMSQDMTENLNSMNGDSKGMNDFPASVKLENSMDIGDDMSDRVYTVDSIDTIPCDGNYGPKAAVEGDDYYLFSPRDSITMIDMGDKDIKKLYLRLQALEADRESMRQAIISMRTDKAQMILLKEIAQHLCKELSPQRKVHEKKHAASRGSSFFSMLKRVFSFVFWRKKNCQVKYPFDVSVNVGLLLLLDKSPQMRHWRCVTRAQLFSILASNQTYLRVTSPT